MSVRGPLSMATVPAGTSREEALGVMAARAVRRLPVTLAGGVVVVEYVFNFPGIGQGLVFAVSNRDIPVVQFIVLVLAAFYVVMNILTDVIALLASPRRRIPR